MGSNQATRLVIQALDSNGYTKVLDGYVNLTDGYVVDGYESIVNQLYSGGIYCPMIQSVIFPDLATGYSSSMIGNDIDINELKLPIVASSLGTYIASILNITE